MLRLLWQLIGWTPLPLTAARREAARQALRRLFVAGALGAFFTAIARTVPLSLKETAWPADLSYTLDTFLRYGFLLWLLTYFFISQLRLEADPEKWDLTYDVVQAGLSLAAAYFLGFIIPGEHYGMFAYLFANLTILVICLLSLAWFRTGPSALLPINRLRWAGVALAGLSCLVATLGGAPATGILGVLAVLQLLLWIALVAYVRIRIAYW